MDEAKTLIVGEDEHLDADLVIELLDQKKYQVLHEKSEIYDAADIAEIIDELPEEHARRFFRLLSKELAAETFVELSPDIQEIIVNMYNDKELAEMVSELYLDDTVDVIEEMPANVVKRILRAATPADRATINQLLRYPKDSAGTIMTTEYVRFREDMTVGQALAHIRKVAIDKETIYTCYITDADRCLRGIVTAKHLLISDLELPLSEIMDENVIYVRTEDDREDVAQLFEKYGFLAMPVVDKENRLVGIVTVDDAIEVMQKETEEDFAKMAAIVPTEQSYLKSTVFDLWRARLPWLLILMVSATFSSMILNFFEAALPVVLILFVPMLMDTGGNSGGQTSVTVIRGISVGEVEFSDLPRVLWKELRVGMLCGASLGIVAFGKVMLVDHLIMQNPEVTLVIALSVAISMCLTVIVAKMIGSLLPILARKVGFDPAVMASPFITTIVDVISLILYFVISSRVFGL